MFALGRYLELLLGLSSARSSGGALEELLSTAGARGNLSRGPAGALAALCDAMPGLKLTVADLRVIAAYYGHGGRICYDVDPNGILVNQTMTGVSDEAAAKALGVRSPARARARLDKVRAKVAKAAARRGPE